MEESALIDKIRKLEEKNKELEGENSKLKAKLKRKNKRPPIKTKIDDIVNYWSRLQDECGLSIDWSEARERCWRCGYESRLERCHIIPDSLNGLDEPSNLVLLCKRCHIDAPNVDSKTYMWDWIRANGTPLYDTFWKIRAQKEYEFIYGKSFVQELMDRDIISDYDLRLFWNLKIGKSIHHFSHPWNNESTEAGLLRMRLEEFDKLHTTINKKSDTYREKESEFDSFLFTTCDIAKKYNFDVWEGRSKNRFSVTFSSFIDRQKNISVSIKLCRGKVYKGCFTTEWNPNNNKAKDYTIELGTRENAINFLKNELEKFTYKYGVQEKQNHIITINPLYSKCD